MDFKKMHWLSLITTRVERLIADVNVPVWIYLCLKFDLFGGTLYI